MTLYREHWVDLTEWLGLDSHGRRQGGTLDAGVIRDDLICISDLKWGRGVPVRPAHNKQIQLYALGFWFNIARHVSQATDFLLIIDQPRHAGGGGEWRTTLDDLLAFGEEVKAAVARTRAPNPPRTASRDGCQWCRRKQAPGGCGTLDAHILKLLELEFDDLDSPEITVPEIITADRRRVLIDHRKMIEDWLETMQAHCLRDALDGNPTGGLKAVLGNKERDTWVDEKGAATATVQPVLGDASFARKLRTPKQVLSEIAPDSLDRLLVEPLVKRGGRKPILVPEDDARPPVTTAAEFEDLE